MNPSWKTIGTAIVFLVVVTTANAADDSEIPEIAPGILKGYLEQTELPDSLALVPPPPAENSPAMALDRARNEQTLAGASVDRVALATRDADIDFPEATESFACALGIQVTQEETPRLYLLMRRSMTDAGLSTYAAKNKYARPRPFMENGAGVCTPDYEEALRANGSYPSGHTAIGWAWALILTEIAPENTDALLGRGLSFGESRMYCNVHWQSDVTWGRVMGAATVARLQANDNFRADLEAAKVEFRQALAAGSTPSHNCEAEAATLAR